LYFLPPLDFSRTRCGVSSLIILLDFGFAFPPPRNVTLFYTRTLPLYCLCYGLKLFAWTCLCHTPLNQLFCCLVKSAGEKLHRSSACRTLNLCSTCFCDSKVPLKWCWICVLSPSPRIRCRRQWRFLSTLRRPRVVPCS